MGIDKVSIRAGIGLFLIAEDILGENFSFFFIGSFYYTEEFGGDWEQHIRWVYGVCIVVITICILSFFFFF